MLRQTKARLFSIPCVLSLLLCTVTGAVWFRSYWVEDTGRWGRATRESVGLGPEISLSWGRITFQDLQLVNPPPPAMKIGKPEFSYYSETSATPDDQSRLPLSSLGTRWSVLGLSHQYVVIYGLRIRVVVVPMWMIFLSTTTLPIAHVIRWRRRMRMRGEIRCDYCGYDLRATPDRCPECGKPPAQTQVSGHSGRINS